MLKLLLFDRFAIPKLHLKIVIEIEIKYECFPFGERFSGDLIVGLSHTEAQTVRTLITHGHCELKLKL